MNVGQKLSLQAWDRVAESICVGTIERLTAEYAEALALLKTKLPMSDQALHDEVKAVRKHLKERFS